MVSTSQLVQPSSQGYAGLVDVKAGLDGSIWFAEDNVDLMARIDPVTFKIDEYKIPYQGHAFPRRMNSDANGDLWVALWNAGKLMKIDHKTKQMTLYTPPSNNGGHYSVIVDKKGGYIWVSEHQVDKIAIPAGGRRSGAVALVHGAHFVRDLVR